MFGNEEILSVVNAIAKERSIPTDILVSSIEDAISLVGQQQYGKSNNIRAKMNRKTGEIRLYRVMTAVEDVFNPSIEISISKAQSFMPDIALGDEYLELLPPVRTGRSEALIAKDVLTSAIRAAEKEKEYEDFSDRVGEIISGFVKRIEFGNYIIDIGRTEAILRSDQVMYTDKLKIRDNIKACIQSVKKDIKNYQIQLSRTSNQMLEGIMAMEIPEIKDGVVEIVSIAREPGSKSKVAVRSIDDRIDAVLVCVGMRGVRIRGVIDVLRGERVEVIQWERDLARYASNAIAPAKVNKVLIDEANHKVEIVTHESQLSMAIGRNGQNVRLASRLIGWGIDVLTEENEAKKRMDEFRVASNLLIDALELDETLGQFLVAKGFVRIDDIINSGVEKLKKIEGFDEELATELYERAKEYQERKLAEIWGQVEQMGIERSLIDLLRFGPEKMLELGKQGIKSIADLSTLNVEEFQEMMPELRMSDERVADLLEQLRSENFM